MTTTTPTREQIYGALFSKVSALQKLPTDTVLTADRPFVWVTREIIEPQRIPPSQQPVLMQYEFNENFEYSGGQLVRKVFQVVYVIGVTHTSKSVGAAILNPLIDAVESLFIPVDSDVIDLGFQGVRVQLDGPGGKDHGDNSTRTDKQAIYYLPIRVALPLAGN